MNILRPLQIFISTSPILLAFLALLVSATPIPSLDVVSNGDTNALIVRGLPLDYHQVKTGIQRLNELMPKMFNPWRYSLPEEDLLKDIRECANLIAPLKEAEAKDIRPGIFMSIGRLKRFVAQSSSLLKDKQDAIRGIKAFEDQAVAKRLPRWVDKFQPPEDLKGVFKGNKDKFTETATDEQANALHKLVGQVLSLTLTEYASVREELEEEYDAIKVKIDCWKEGKNKTDAEQLIWDHWGPMVTLAGIFSAMV